MRAPERIWAGPDAVMGWEFAMAELKPLPALNRTTEYVRADLHDTLRAERDALAARVERLEGALREIARQKKTDELDTEYDVEVADFEGGYDMCVDRARAALSTDAQ
jgi:hypothetical protein